MVGGAISYPTIDNRTNGLNKLISFSYSVFSIFCLVLIFVVVNSAELIGQDDLDNDEPWNLEELDPTELDTIQGTAELDYYNSHGWFPSTRSLRTFIGLMSAGQYVNDFGEGISPNGAFDIGKPYSAGTSLPEDDVREMYESLSDGDPGLKSGEYGPIRDASRVGLSLSVTTGLPLWVDINGTYFSATNIAYTRLSERRFRKRNGDVASFDEGHYLVVEQEGYSFGALGTIPLYGAFMTLQGFDTYMAYELSLGWEREVSTTHTVTQYSQIETNASELRYRNGLDTIFLAPPQKLASYDITKNYIPVGVGWAFYAQVVLVRMNLSYDFGLDNMFVSEPWTSDRFSVRFYLGIRLW